MIRFPPWFWTVNVFTQCFHYTWCFFLTIGKIDSIWGSLPKFVKLPEIIYVFVLIFNHKHSVKVLHHGSLKDVVKKVKRVVSLHVRFLTVSDGLSYQGNIVYCKTIYTSHIKIYLGCGGFWFTLRRLSGSIWPFHLPLWLFLTFVFQKKVEAHFFATFNIVISHMFTKNFNGIPQLVQKIWIFFLQCYLFSSIFCIFLHFFVAKKPMTPAYIRWCQHFFNLQPTLNRLINNFIQLYWY